MLPPGITTAALLRRDVTRATSRDLPLVAPVVRRGVARRLPLLFAVTHTAVAPWSHFAHGDARVGAQEEIRCL